MAGCGEKQERIFTLHIPEGHLVTIRSALGRLPYDVAEKVVANLWEQVEKQVSGVRCQVSGEEGKTPPALTVEKGG